MSFPMITIKAENYNLISQDFYNKTIDSLDLNLITCTCGHSGCLIRYGFYKRNVQLKDELITLTIVRVYCTACGHTHALLLSSLVPYSQIPLNVQISAIHAYESGHALSHILADQCFIDGLSFFKILKNKCSTETYSSPIAFASSSALIIALFKCCPIYGCPPETFVLFSI